MLSVVVVRRELVVTFLIVTVEPARVVTGGIPSDDAATEIKASEKQKSEDDVNASGGKDQI